MSDVKICGLSDAARLEDAIEAGARFAGFVFFPPSPRHLDYEQAAALCALAKGRIARVGLLVRPDDAAIRAACDCDLDWLQIVGVGEEARIAQIRALSGLPLIRAFSIAEAADLRAALQADPGEIMLLDAKARPGAALPGGNGLSFDWRLLAKQQPQTPWMLAGGLTPQNAAQAAELTGARLLDVSSGVESAPGVKEGARIRAFIKAARG